MGAFVAVGVAAAVVALAVVVVFGVAATVVFGRVALRGAGFDDGNMRWRMAGTSTLAAAAVATNTAALSAATGPRKRIRRTGGGALSGATPTVTIERSRCSR